MKVELLHYTPLSVSDQAIGQCWDAGCYTGDKMIQRMDRVANKDKHKSTIEHLYYNFQITDVSRALLQELARHRIASFSVKSSRYTIKELKTEDSFDCFDLEDFERSKKYIYHTGTSTVDNMSIRALEGLRILIKNGISNDVAKYAMPECYLTSLVFSINARSLQNLIFLRSSKAALDEIQLLAHGLYNELPEDHKFLFKEMIKEYKGHKGHEDTRDKNE
jgi:thymidylate synthase (FAD)